MLGIEPQTGSMTQWFEHHSWAIYLMGTGLTLVLTVWGIVLWRSGEAGGCECELNDGDAIEPSLPQPGEHNGGGDPGNRSPLRE